MNFTKECERCGKSARNPGRSWAAWGGVFCGMRCAFATAGERQAEQLAKESEVRARVEASSREIERRLQREADEHRRLEWEMSA